ncbi:LysM peptidoglycan-binding domain-containing protein [Bacillus cereus group sp. BfR-BA-01380]|uniref:LysM peptidoglycan-binding domain-containing protein n=1 Tax=Bacillus cereus group sp. BfR-BA-01380 TaxID=2920324 RepID=UPI001F575E62|nr:LysM peptidoglycan-binding domain-containing protein [Bacillus cereus group sp. BfR-BA-01380]
MATGQTTEFEENMKESTQTEEGLPPRSEVHKDKQKKKSKFKIKHFFVRILTVLFILLPVGVLWCTERYIVEKNKESAANSKQSAFEVIFFDSKKKTNHESKETFQFHTVKEGETLEEVAKKYFPNEDGVAIIKKYNEVAEELEPGQVLKIPKKTGSEQKK